MVQGASFTQPVFAANDEQPKCADYGGSEHAWGTETEQVGAVVSVAGVVHISAFTISVHGWFTGSTVGAITIR